MLPKPQIRTPRIRSFGCLTGHAASLLAGYAVFVSVGAGQIVDTGRISGLVRDSSGSRIAIAKILCLAEATGAQFPLWASSEGFYITPPLSPGDYELTASASGFSSVIQHVHVEVAQRVAADFTLVPGAANEAIEVKAFAPLLESESTAISNERNENDIRNLPLNGRNFAELLSLAPGVVDAHTQLSGFLSIPSARGETSYSANGLRPEENHFLIDGISDNENHNGLGLIIFPPIDAVQEFRQETSVADARYGHGGGETVNLILKSGSSTLHASLFEFVRNSDLDARNFFDASKPAFRMNDFGGTIGGPLLPGKDPRTFFFADYEGTRREQALTFLSTVPTPAMRIGDFSAAPQKIYDPTSQVALPGGGFSRTPFAGNIVSPSLIDRVGANLIRLYPLPNLPGIANNFLYQPAYRVQSDHGDFRLDHRFSRLDQGFVRYTQERADFFQPGRLPAPAVGGSISGFISEPSQQAVLSETHVFTASMVSTARLGWSRVNIRGTDVNNSQPYAAQVGIPGSNIPGNPVTYGLPNIGVTGAASLGSFGNLPAIVVSNNYQFDANLSVVRGRHALQAGGDLTRLQYNVLQTANFRGTLSFSTAYSSNPAAPAGTGLGLADLLLGKPASGSLQYLDGTRGLRRTDISLYLQDDYKISDRITMNLGVRYENYLGYPWQEVADRAYQFVPPSSVIQAGTAGIPRSGVQGRNLNFMPRAGISTRISAKTVIRAGYGIFYSAPQVGLGIGIAANPPDVINTAFTNNQFDFTDAIAASQGFSRPAIGAISGSALNAMDPHAHLPYTQQWNVTVRHQLTSASLISAAYIGTAGTHLQSLININQAIPGLTPVTQRLPYPLFQNIMDVADVDTSRYHALQLAFERRFSRGLSVTASYTWSHALDASSVDANVLQPVVDTYNRRLDYGNADFDVRHRLVASASYLLPGREHGWLRYAAAGWQLNGILSVYTGLPFSVQSATNTLNIGSNSRAAYTGTGNGALPTGEQSIQEWFDVSAFSAPPALQFGDVGRNTLRGPDTVQLDLSIFKNFVIRENSPARLQLRAEAFNIANHPQFNNPAATIGAPGAGTITSAGSPATFQRLSREVQFAVKLFF